MSRDVTLIVNADDLGYDPAVTRGILRAMRQGVVTSTTLMVNTPWAEDAAREADELSVGLHLNLARHPPLPATPPARRRARRAPRRATPRGRRRGRDPPPAPTRRAPPRPAPDTPRRAQPPAPLPGRARGGHPRRPALRAAGPLHRS